MIPRPLAFELHCPADRSVLNWIRGVIVHTASELGFAGDDLDKIELSVDEACANVIDHAYPVPPDDNELPLVIRLEVEPGVLRITVIDKGVGCEKLASRGVTSVDEYVERKRHRGLGTYIMQRFMDEVEFSQTPGQGTIVSMVKFLETTEGTLEES